MKCNNNNLISPIYYVPDDYVIWRHIPGFNGYQINNFGEVRSYKHYKRDTDYGHYMMLYPKGATKPNMVYTYVVISDNRHNRKRMFTYQLMNLAFNADYIDNVPENTGTYQCGFHRLKDIPTTEEERSRLGYGIYDNLAKAMTSEDTVEIDLFGNIL